MCCVLNVECVHDYGIVCVCVRVHVEYVYYGHITYSVLCIHVCEILVRHTRTRDGL